MAIASVNDQVLIAHLMGGTPFIAALDFAHDIQSQICY
jgi:hypothetical protein